MKKFKKIMAVLVAAMMIMATWAPAMVFAASEYVITVRNALNGESYTAYKIFSATEGEMTAVKVQIPLTEISREENKKILEANKYFYKNQQTGAFMQITAENLADVVNGSYTVYEEVLKPVAYTLGSDDTWYDAVWSYAGRGGELRFDPIAGTSTTYAVTFTDSFKPADFAAHLKACLGDSTNYPGLSSSPAAGPTTPGTGNGTAENAVTLDVGSAGYFFVDTTLGAFCALDSTTKTVDMYEKNKTPTLKKSISEDTGATKTYTEEGTVSVDIGDHVFFKIVVTDGIGTNQAITIKDTMSRGLTLIPTFTVVKKGDPDVPWTENNQYTLSIDANTPVSEGTYEGDLDCSFQIVLPATTVGGLNTGDKVEITYEAILNADAAIYYKSANNMNTNSAKLTYSHQTTPDSTCNVKTYEFTLLKKDGETAAPLKGVNFTLQNSEDKYYKVKSGTNSVWQDDENPLPTGDDGKITFTGLDAGDYILTETFAKPGYNRITQKIKVTIADTADVTAALQGNAPSNGEQYLPATPVANDTTSNNVTTPATLTVNNYQGKELPSTGGMGTTVLYIVGGMLVILAGAYLFFSRKRTA